MENAKIPKEAAISSEFCILLNIWLFFAQNCSTPISGGFSVKSVLKFT